MDFRRIRGLLVHFDLDIRSDHDTLPSGGDGMRKNDSRVLEAVAKAAQLPKSGFSVEEDGGWVMVNHPDSMKWPERWPAIRRAVEALTGMSVSIN